MEGYLFVVCIYHLTCVIFNMWSLLEVGRLIKFFICALSLASADLDCESPRSNGVDFLGIGTNHFPGK